MILPGCRRFDTDTFNRHLTVCEEKLLYSNENKQRDLAPDICSPEFGNATAYLVRAQRGIPRPYANPSSGIFQWQRTRTLSTRSALSTTTWTVSLNFGASTYCRERAVGWHPLASRAYGRTSVACVSINSERSELFYPGRCSDSFGSSRANHCSRLWPR